MLGLKIRFAAALFLSFFTLTLAGCKSSGESSGSGRSEAGTSGSERIANEVRNRADSIAARSESDLKTAPPPRVTGKYAVQIGAYTTYENAVKTADAAKERFNLLVYTFHDKNDNLFKVYVGDFLIKDEARSYRDDIVRRYPGEYNDAWVSEHPVQ